MNAVISSRTPEGEPFRCPVCDEVSRIEPSRPPGDAPCPACGHLIQFPGRPEGGLRPRFLVGRAEHLLRSEPRRPMFGLVATISRQVRRMFDGRGRRERRRPEAVGTGVWDPWLDGPTGG